ncbi:Uncharacterised protein [Candidatus Ornithobacterium hominis]|nr:Uncharacterised protein [Candidatus Ornithobacterium hominis]
MAVVACKKEKFEGKIVGKNENGEELTVNAQGDTITLKEAEALQKTDTTEETMTTAETEKVEKKTAFQKNEDGTYSFQFNLEKGQTYPFKVSTNTTSTQSDGKNSQQISQISTNELSYEVIEEKLQSYVLKVTFKRFQEKSSMQGESIGFDTNAGKPTNEMAAQQYEFFKTIVGNSYTMEISKNGKVLDIDGLAPIREKVKSKLAKGLSEEEKKGLDQMLQVSLSKQAMEAMFLESIGYYPTKSVKIGESWEMNNSTDNAKAQMKYTLKNVADDQVDIQISGSSSGRDSNTLEQGVKISRSIEGNVTGTAKIDARSGWLNQATIEKKEVLKITQEYQGQKQNMSSTTKSTTKVN